MKKIFVVVMVIFILSLVSCAKPNPLIGAWKSSIFGLDAVFTFDTNSTYSVSVGKEESGGTWLFVDGKLILADSGGKTSELPITLGENQFSITDSGSPVGLVFERQQ